MRHRDRVSREVKIEERRYDKAGQEHTPPVNVSTRGEPFDTTSLDNFDSIDEVPVPLPPSSAGSFGSSYLDEEANSDNPYAWAQRLREIPDKVCDSDWPLLQPDLSFAHNTAASFGFGEEFWLWVPALHSKCPPPYILSLLLSDE